MRGILFSLLLANVGVFAYFQFFSPSVESAPAAVSPASMGDYRILTLLSDQELEQRSDQAAQVSSQPEQAVCTLVGPFPELLAAEYFVERLSALGVLSTIQNLTVSGDPGFWLHLEPLVSRKESLNLLTELQQKNIDSYIIPTGDLENGISLGMFSDRDRASDMQSSIARLGYSPQILEVTRDQSEIWLYLPQGEAAKIADNRWIELLSVEESLEKRQNLCSDVASG